MTEITRQEMQDVPTASACYLAAKCNPRNRPSCSLYYMDQRLKAPTLTEQDTGKRLDICDFVCVSRDRNLFVCF